MVQTHQGAVLEKSLATAAMRQGMAKGRNEKDDDLRLTFVETYPNLRAVSKTGPTKAPQFRSMCHGEASDPANQTRKHR